MSSYPINFTAKSLKEAQKKLNELVDTGVYDFSRVEFMSEKVHNVTVNSDGSKEDRPETVYRFAGLGQAVDGQDLDEFTTWKVKNDELKKEREVMNRQLKLLNGKAFGPLSVFLLIVGLIVGVLGVLALVGILPIPKEQIGISIALTGFGVLFIGLSILASVIRGNKIKAMQKDRGDIENDNNALSAKENKLLSEEPAWHAHAVFRTSGSLIYNDNTRFDLDRPERPGPGPRPMR